MGKGSPHGSGGMKSSSGVQGQSPGGVSKRQSFPEDSDLLQIIQQCNRRSHFALHTPITSRQQRNDPICCCVTSLAASALQCTVNAEENRQNCPFPLGFRYPIGGRPSHGHRQHAQKFGKDRACGFGDMLAANRQPDRQTYSSQYFATAPADEVTIMYSEKKYFVNFALHLQTEDLCSNGRHEGIRPNSMNHPLIRHCNLSRLHLFHFAQW